MLSYEEKEAIEWLKRLVKINKRDNLDNTFAEILLNLIEKQQKENTIEKNYIPKEKVIEALQDIEDYFDRLNGPDEDIEFIQSIKDDLLKDGGE